MKTNQNLVRKLNDFEIVQRTRDGFFNATYIIKQWNILTGQKKEITKFLDLEGTKSFVKSLIKIENLDTQNGAYVKSRASRGVNAGTWLHPYLFVKLMMWLSPDFEVHVIKFVYDNLILFRIEGGDAYKEMNKEFDLWLQRNKNRRPDKYDYINLANHIKKMVGVKEWNWATEKQLKNNLYNA